jgi:hypothetical protein
MRKKEKKGEEMSGDREEEEPSPPKLKLCVRHWKRSYVFATACS